MALKLASWNVNGLRSCLSKGFAQWLEVEGIDVACLQEVKTPAMVLEGMEIEGYTPYWHAAEKPGYSGTAVLVKNNHKASGVTYGLGVPEIDREGRVLTVEFEDFTLVNVYAPHSQRELARLPYKLDFCKALDAHLTTLRAKGKPLLMTGDLNVAHHEIDLANPKANKNNAGFLPDERAWMDAVVTGGMVDAFRHYNPEPGHYTWWSQRVGVRAKNIGWRIDYFLTDKSLMERVAGCTHQPLQMGSDHCPVVLELN
ncbi:MAG: exodeoxyribonuclease III [Alphaproteobacteria bacterium]|nr:MAG: exodeoxyribonuclease III [Alphaproteobacteria bacterium]